MEDIRDSFKQDTENPGECTGMKHDGKEESVHPDQEERENMMDTCEESNRPHVCKVSVAKGSSLRQN